MRIFIDGRTREVYSADDIWDEVFSEQAYQDVLEDAMRIYFDNQEMTDEDYAATLDMSFNDLDDELRDELIDDTLDDYLLENFDIYDIDERDGVKKVNMSTAW